MSGSVSSARAAASTRAAATAPDALGRAGQRRGEGVRRAGRRRLDGADDPGQQPPRVGVGGLAGDPGDRAAAVLEGRGQRGRLAAAGRRHEHQRAAVERGREPPVEGGAVHSRNPNPRRWRVVDLLELMARAPGAQAVLDALAGEPGVHVVGGAVRDALLGRVPRELDVVVEGDAVAVARRAAERLGASWWSTTASARPPCARQAATFDVVTARTETYAEPGALPDVRPGATIEEDLARRDFTVNAIALRIADGALAEWPGARGDLAAGVLRVLHERSFEDDPTRLLRMARYGARLGFEPDPDTDALAAAATVDTVSGGRLGSELRLLLREPQPAALLALERHGLGRAVVHPAFRADADARSSARSRCARPTPAPTSWRWPRR